MSMIFRITILLLISQVPLAWADGFSVHRDGPFHILIPSQHEMSLTHAKPTANLDCAAVMQKLKNAERGILRCSDGAARPESYCELLREDLRRNLRGIINEPFGRFEAAATQHWVLAVGTARLSTAEKSKYIDDLRLASPQVIVADSEVVKLDDLELVFDAQSYSQRLKQARLLEWNPTVSVQRRAPAELEFVSHDKLTACELKAGKIRVQALAQRRASYDSIADLNAGTRQWDLHVDLAEALAPMQDDPIRSSLYAGYFLGRFLSDETELVPSEEALFELVKIHLVTSTQDSKVRNFENRFELFLQLPQLSHVIEDGVQIIGEVQDELE